MENKEEKPLQIKTYWLLIIGGVIIFAVPSLFITLNLFGVSFYETGQIGDTIGGLTSPFIGLGGAILVYISFQEQVKANKQIQSQINQSHLERNFEFINNEIERLIDSDNKVIEKEFELEIDRIEKYVRTLKEGEKNLSYFKKDSVRDYVGKSAFEHNTDLVNKSLKDIKKIILVMDEMIQITLSKEHKIIIYRKFQYETNFIKEDLVMDLVKKLETVDLGFLLKTNETLIRPINDQLVYTKNTLLLLHSYLREINETLFKYNIEKELAYELK